MKTAHELVVDAEHYFNQATLAHTKECICYGCHFLADVREHLAHAKAADSVSPLELAKPRIINHTYTPRHLRIFGSLLEDLNRNLRLFGFSVGEAALVIVLRRKNGYAR